MNALVAMLARVVLIAAGLLFAVWLVLAAHAQIVAPQPCGASLECLQQRVKDLQDYRSFLEDQLALAKSLNAGLQNKLVDLEAKLARCQPVPELPPRPDKDLPK